MKILVLASVRTGSTALANAFSKIYRCENWGEFFFHTNYRDNIDNFLLKEKKSWITKIMPDQIIDPYFSKIIEKADNIYGIYRRDTIAQIASFFIANKRQQFQFQSTEPKIVDSIEYEDFELDYCIEHVKRLNSIYNQTLKPLCSKEYVYEDIKNFFTISGLRKSDRPSNYEDIVQSIKKCIDS